MSGEDGIETGEQIETDYFRATDSDFQPGDRVVFRLRHPAFRHAATLPELAGEILAVAPGYELAYAVKVLTTGIRPWPTLFVRRADILKAWV